MSNLTPQTSPLKPRVVFAADHAGYPLKEILKPFVVSLGHEVTDVGAHTLDREDDYVPFMQALAKEVSAQGDGTLGIALGGSGQGEAIAVNRYKGIRAVVYYGEPSKNQVDAEGKELGILTSSREHNNANVLSLGARFISEEEAKIAVKVWLEAPFLGKDRHIRRIRMIDQQS